MTPSPRLPLPALGTALLFLGLSACDSSTDPGPRSCDPGEGVQLQLGETAGFQGQDARIVCVTSPGSSAEYVLVTFAANTSSSEGISLAVRGDHILPPVGAAPHGDAAAMAADRRTGLGEGADRLAELRRDLRIERRLRELERQALGSRIRPGPWATVPIAGQTTGADPRSPGALRGLASPPTPGEFLEINTRTASTCDDPRYRTGRVVAVTEKAIVVADTLNPSNGFTDDRYQHFAATFDTLIAPLSEAAFGEVSDVGQNGRTILFFTQDVNLHSESDSDQFIGGFFFARDLFPREEVEGGRLAPCEHSNEAELLYLMVPDPDGTINGNQRSLDFVERVTLTTIIHELQHLTNAAQRLFVVEIQTGDQFEEVWLNEGLSHIAEELLLYETTPYDPGQNLDVTDFPEGPLRTLFNRHQVGNLFRFESFVENPSVSSPYNTEDVLSTRGATWHFLRYAADRRGGNQTTLFRELVATSETGLQNLADALTPHGPPLSQWFTDWSVALYADDQVPGIEARFRDSSWNHRSFFAAINADQDPTYPLRIRSLEHGTVLAVSLMGGGAAYFRFGLGAGATGLVELTTAGGNPPAGLRATLLRVN